MKMNRKKLKNKQLAFMFVIFGDKHRYTEKQLMLATLTKENVEKSDPSRGVATRRLLCRLFCQ